MKYNHCYHLFDMVHSSNTFSFARYEELRDSGMFSTEANCPTNIQRTTGADSRRNKDTAKDWWPW